MNKKNEIIKHKFLDYLENAKGFAPASIVKYERAIHIYETCFNNKDFGKFNLDRAIEYKEYLVDSGYSEGSFRTYLHHIKKFFTWLSSQVGYRRKIIVDHIEYLNASKGSNRLAAQNVMVEYPTGEEVMRIFNALPSRTEVELRNKCLIALTYCTGMRDNSIRTLLFSSVNIEKMYVEQNPRKGTNVKFSKIIYSKIFPFDDKLISIIREYYQLLISKQFNALDPFFPQSKRRVEENGLCFTESTEIGKERWKSLESIRTIFKESAKVAGTKYYYPHLFRHAGIRRMMDCAQSGIEIKAVYQSIGHESFKTILESYANLDLAKQLEILSNMELNPDKKQNECLVRQAMELIEDVKKL